MKPSKNFTRFLQQPRFRVQCTDLTPELATQIIELELELDKSVSLLQVQALISLYTKAVEHYESQENPKYIDFQEKLQKLLMKPQVFSLLQCTSKPASSTSPCKLRSTSPSKQNTENNRKSLSLQLESTLETANPMSVINSHSTISKETCENVISVIKSQEKDLDSKLQARKLKKEQREREMQLASNVFSCDMSFVELESNTSTVSSLINSQDLKENYEKYERKLEEVMERNLNEKALKVLEIRQKYEKEFEEIKNCEGFVEMILTEMKKNMSKEIEEVHEVYDKKRKAEIQRLKEDINS